MDKYGNPILNPDGGNIFLDSDGFPRSPNAWPYMLDENRQLINGPDNKPLLIDVNRKPVTSDGRPILQDENGKPILGENNLPIALEQAPKGFK